MSDDSAHRLAADTDALLALGSSEAWEQIATNVGISTTYACKSELHDHRQRGNTTYDFQVGARKTRLANSAEKVLDSISDSSSQIKCHFLHSCRSGEHSIAQLANTYPEDIEGILMMDSGEEDELEIGGRELVKSRVDLNLHDISFPSPAFPLAVLYKHDKISKEQFCEETDRIIRQEDWTSYAAIKRMWTEIPVDCGGYVPSKHLTSSHTSVAE